MYNIIINVNNNIVSRDVNSAQWQKKIANFWQTVYNGYQQPLTTVFENADQFLRKYPQQWNDFKNDLKVRISGEVTQQELKKRYATALKNLRQYLDESLEPPSDDFDEREVSYIDLNSTSILEHYDNSVLARPSYSEHGHGQVSNSNL